MSKNVTVYSTPTCPYCRLAKEYLDRNGIAYQDYDVSADRAKAEEMVEKTGQMGVPVLVVGDDVIIGFDQEALNKALGL